MYPELLPYLVGLPIIAGASCLFLPDKIGILSKIISILVTVAAMAGAIFVFIVKPVSWQAGSQIIFSADALSCFVGIGVAFFALMITIYSLGFIEKQFGRYFGYVLMTLGSSLGVAYSDHLIALLVFWGYLAALLYLLINIQGTDKAAASAKKALIIIGGTDAFMLFGIGMVWALSGTFSMGAMKLELNRYSAWAAYLCLTIACFAKAGAMPVHSWLPDVAEDGPTPVTAYLPASLDKLLGIYLLARLSLDMFVMNRASNFILLLAGSITIILAVLLALVQHDFKRLLGYHAVSQVGYMVLGIGTGNPVGIAGGLFHMFNHAIYKSCLFLSGGNVEKKAGTADLAKLGGLAKYMPVTFIGFSIASLSISGIPPFNGFVSKWMIYQGILEMDKAKDPLWILWLVAAMFGSALTLASFMKLLHAIFLGRSSKASESVKEAPFSMYFPVVVLAAICLIFGVFAFTLPMPLFIAPAIGLEIKYLGMWNPMAATALMIAGIILGFIAYYALRPKTFRTVEAFVGGEDQEKMGRVSGAEFYNTIKDIKALEGVYKRDEEGKLDIYYLARKAVYPFTRFLQYLHNGVLPTYLVWCLLGMLVMFLFMILR